MNESPASLRDFLRPKLGAYVGLSLATCLGLLLVPVFVGQFHEQFVGGPFRESAWWEAAPLAWLRERTGLSLLPLLYLAPVAISFALFAVFVAFEAVAWGVRADRADHAWSSFVWALRSWRGWLRWLLRALAWALLGVLALALPDRWHIVGLVPGLVALASLPFVAFNARSLREETPPRRWRMRWPGITAFVVGVVGIVLMKAADLLAMASQRVELDLLFWLLSLPVVAFLLIGWMDRSPPSRWSDNVRRAVRPRLLGAMATQGVRLGLIVVALWIALLPAVVLTLRALGLFNDWLETQVVSMQPEMPQTASAIAGVARFSIRWWWFGLMALFVVPATPMTWFAAVASGRLLVQLDAVPAESGDARA